VSFGAIVCLNVELGELPVRALFHPRVVSADPASYNGFMRQVSRSLAGNRRCSWAESTPEMMRYHDTEWGRPVHDDRQLFEMLLLEGAQAGLSWETILRRREGYRHVFAGFDPVKVAAFDRAKKAALLRDERIIRNRLKIDAAVTNAQAFLAVQHAFGSFDAYVWQFVGGKPLANRRTRASQIPTSTRQSDALSKDLRQRGFRFVGSTIIYAFMQAVGMVNDHTADCFLARGRR
jgi:DNA-3-methyladenine glycosylase I